MKYIVITKKVILECFVESAKDKSIKYKVSFDSRGWNCACKNYQLKKQPCKHIKFIKADQKI